MSTPASGSETGHHGLNSELRVVWMQLQAGEGGDCLSAGTGRPLRIVGNGKPMPESSLLQTQPGHSS